MENVESSFTIGMGTVMHQRENKNLLSFRYPIFNLIINEEKLKASTIKFESFWFLQTLSKDYLDGTVQPLSTKIRTFLSNKLDYSPDSIKLQTIPRMFGYVFNPVSFWMCYKKNNLDAVLCEVNNTLGDRHFYFLQVNKDGSELILPKEFYVSPFFPIRGSYLFNFDMDHANSRTGIQYFNERSERQLTTFLDLKLYQPTEISPGKLLLKYGWMTPLILIRIHILALKLLLKKVRFYSHPTPPDQEVTK